MDGGERVRPGSALEFLCPTSDYRPEGYSFAPIRTPNPFCCLASKQASRARSTSDSSISSSSSSSSSSLTSSDDEQAPNTHQPMDTFPNQPPPPPPPNGPPPNVDGRGNRNEHPRPHSAEKKQKKRRRVKLHVDKLYEAGGGLPLWEPQSMVSTVSEGVPQHRTFLVLQQCVSETDISMIHQSIHCAGAIDCHDRSKKLDFRHQVHRIERALKEDLGEQGRQLYDRLLQMMAWADHSIWQKLQRKHKVYPEVEYISYDATGGEPKYIEPHIDNDSVVTLVMMLSHPDEYQGGINMFKSAGGKNGHGDRKWQLDSGDAVFFRGESLTHWITPVTGGKRCILQIELSKK